jgi:hypothetical protein
MRYLETTADEPLLVIEVGEQGSQAFTCRLSELFGEVYDREDMNMLAWFKWALPSLMGGGSVSVTGEIEAENGDSYQQMMSYSTSHPEPLRAQWDALLSEMGVREEDLPAVEEAASGDVEMAGVGTDRGGGA